jgi:hypothetical protein
VPIDLVSKGLIKKTWCYISYILFFYNLKKEDQEKIPDNIRKNLIFKMNTNAI